MKRTMPRTSPRSSRKTAAITPSPKKKSKKTTAAVVAVAAVIAAEPTLALSSSTRTSSFGACWAGSIDSLKDQDIKVHTLILGTHPSVESLNQNQYYGHDMNAFWWIAGDCLGFRRDTGVSPKTGKVFKFSEHLRHQNILPYTQQLETMCSSGFAIWDVVASCERPGSLDQDISNDIPNDIRGFCEEHSELKRIVLANGGTGSSMFLKHFKDWWLEGGLVPGNSPESQRSFAAIYKRATKNRVPSKARPPIECISALAVSPAAARSDYQTKRDSWETNVYQPGLELHRELQQQQSTE